VSDAVGAKRLVNQDTWTELRALTPARIALGRVGASLPTTEVLSLGLAHSRACDAVQRKLDIQQLRRDAAVLGQPVIEVASRAADRTQYLVRPDLGRLLRPEQVGRLSVVRESDLAFVLSDGLSATAVQRHAIPVLLDLWPRVQRLTKAPLVIASQARVALSDEIGELLRARLAVNLIGERPGLSAPDSLGIYLTYGPRRGNTDEKRNCISNIRPGGLSYCDAADMLEKLIRDVLGAKRSGVALQAR
jgi:ethanolamine ammonia-lyase small subunit